MQTGTRRCRAVTLKQVARNLRAIGKGERKTAAAALSEDMVEIYYSIKERLELGDEKGAIIRESLEFKRLKTTIVAEKEFLNQMIMRASE
jgi:hypothetical protein